MSKMQITTDIADNVTLSYDEDGERVTREFTCPRGGGYVHEERPNGSIKQVCGELSWSGSTLIAASRETLPELIRREYRAMRSADKREAARY